MKKPIQIGIYALLITACSSGITNERYYPMKNHLWKRYDILRFEIPIQKPDIAYDISLQVTVAKEFPFENLPFNVVMNTPSGEERINEYTLKIKTKTDLFLGKWAGDSCVSTILLKKGMEISKTGNLILEIENLTPRLVTEGILGIGINVSPSSK